MSLEITPQMELDLLYQLLRIRGTQDGARPITRPLAEELHQVLLERLDLEPTPLPAPPRLPRR